MSRFAAALTGWSGGLRELRLTFDGWMMASALLVLSIVCPLLVIVVGLFQPTGEVWEHIRSTLLVRYTVNTLLLIASTALVTLVLGAVTAWLIALYDFPGKRFLDWALVLPLAIPTYIAAFAYAGLLDYTGPVQAFLRWSKIGTRLTFDIMSMGGVVFVISFVLYPYVYLLARNAFRSQSASMLEAARMMGKSPFTVFARVGLPASRTALAAGVGLVVMETLNDYGAVSYYGVDTLTTGIFRAWFGMDDFDSAVRLSACLMILTFFLLVLERWQRGRARYHGRPSERVLTATRLVGGRALAAMMACMTPFLFGFLVPFFQLSYWAVIALDEGSSNQMLGWIWNSFRLGAFTAALIVVVAIVIAYTARLHRHLAIDVLSRFALVGYSIPGAVIAVGVLVILISSDRFLNSWTVKYFGISTGLLLTGSVVGLIFAYLVRFLAVGYGAV
ncbi:MAG TPA: iron ABC transporter permease, partial [Acidobacteriota bacterium]|nr:iron ABC transporter permease [Acidobacteriota bacterium]